MKVSVLGVGATKFGELWNVSPRALARDAMTQALVSAKKSANQIDALFVGNMLADVLGNQANLGSMYAEVLGVSVPSFHIEGACASGGLALHAAINAILSEQYKTVMVLGVEKMTDCQPDDITSGLMAAGSDEERLSGATFPGIYALMAKAYMDEYKISEELLVSVSVKNHYHGSLNPKAQFQKIYSLEDVMKSTKIADPLKLLECSPVSDGAAAVVISSMNPSAIPGQVKIVASEVGTDTLGLSDRNSFTTLDAVVKASKNAYKKAGIKPSDIDVAEVRDCFSIAEVLAVEDLGFSKKGMGAKNIADGKLTLGTGKIVVNPSGGLKACGHPVGATGIKQIVEIFEQLRGTAGKGQVKNAKIGLTHNVGGSGAIAAIHILKDMITTPVKLWRRQKDTAAAIGKTGVILQWTIIRIPPRSFVQEAPYPVVIAKVDGKNVIGQLVDYQEEDLVKGRKVVTVLRKLFPEDPESVIAYIIKFKPT